MNFEPVNKFWIEPTRDELAAQVRGLRTIVVILFVAAMTGWGLFILKAFQ